MPLAGKGMLLTSMDVDAAHEEDLNRWYDREHLEERVAIDGFLEARRYVAHAGSPKNLFLYSTSTIEVLDSPAYRSRLANPTPGSKTNMANFKNMIRVVAHVTLSRGVGRGSKLGIVRLKGLERLGVYEIVDAATLDGASLRPLRGERLVAAADRELTRPLTQQE